MEKTGFKGKVYMTHPTKAIYKWLLADYVKVSNVAGDDDQLYTEADLTRSYERITPIDYHQEVEVNGVKFTALNAGHVLGAAMFLIEIAGVKVLYTGDYSREEDRHLMAAETPSSRPDVLVCESTYGVHSHQPRLEREKRFTDLVHEIVGRGGRCLIPVFALGRAQELLLILDEYWQAHPELHSVPVYYASPLAKKCMSVYQTYVNMMNDRIRRQIAVSNPFIFRHVANLRSMEHLKDTGPCVMMASPAMLQNGLSRELLELWCPNPKNGLIIPGYVVEGTLAKTILTEPKEITALSGATMPLRMSVEYISFSAHVDFVQNSEFIDILKPPHLILVHGEANEMLRLKSALQHKYNISDKNLTPASFLIGTKTDTIINIHTPRNCESVDLCYRGEKMIKIVGNLATDPANKVDGSIVEGVLVGKDFEYQLIKTEDLPEYVQNVRKVQLLERQAVTCRAPFTLIEYLLSQLYGKKNVKRCSSDDSSLVVMGSFQIQNAGKGEYLVEWEGSPMNDLTADSIVMLLLGAESSRAAVKATKSEHSHVHDHSHDHDHLSHAAVIPPKDRHQVLIKSYLENYFGILQELNIDDENVYQFTLNDQTVTVSQSDYSVECTDRDTFDQVTRTLHKIVAMLDPDFII
ncbi:Beta-Casp domain-containing protein [Paramicrosporidium saccamoebae]|uniref:Endoribonuclease YSH1 n=1 Tax=Paramicrosporidium saccamoebae TaxID=1246581 RepID=A0A2H9TL40_9FUNG|nr:Beta-Casp domain-containing protein [Paramicrosporidium saccamoebae]